MSDELRELREAAEAATPGPWDFTHNGWDESSVNSRVALVATCHIDSQVDEDTQDRFEAIKEANARFIALANPQTILALLARLSAAERDGWRSVADELPKCSRTAGSLGTPVQIWPVEDNAHVAFYGRRITSEPRFYLYGRVLHHVTHWRPLTRPAIDTAIAATQEGSDAR